MMQTTILEQIAEWRLEAADEDSGRYFFNIEEVEKLEIGSRCYVIGRKGTGKSAICRYFETSIDYDRFCAKLSFKEFPFNILYSLEDKAFTTPSQYISLWKYYIYSSILMMMVRNQNIDATVRDKISTIYPSDDFEYISAKMQKWTGRSFGVTLGKILGLNMSETRTPSDISSWWSEIIPAMERIIHDHIDSAKYYVVFDELDEDYRNYWEDSNRDRYTPLILGLFKAVSSVRRAFSLSQAQIFPIVFLRDDIYELLQDPDKNKWEDNKIYLNWKGEKIQRMLGFRIARAEISDASDFDFLRNWAKVFVPEVMGIGAGKRKKIKTFDYLMEMSHSRPRDFIRLLKECAKSSLEQGHKRVTEDTVRGIERDYSIHLREELQNEIRGVIPNIAWLFDEIGKGGKPRIANQAFVESLDEIIAKNPSKFEGVNLSGSMIARILFHFSVIGNAARANNRPYYRYQRPNQTINHQEAIVIHRGLEKAFGLN